MAEEMHRGMENEPSVILTDKAIEMVREAMGREGVKEGGLRVAVVGGGCSGFQYTLSIEEHPHADDTIIIQDGVKIYVDSNSAERLKGTTLDYVVSLQGAGFRFLNPNATRTCGCGSSFSA